MNKVKRKKSLIIVGYVDELDFKKKFHYVSSVISGEVQIMIVETKRDDVPFKYKKVHITIREL